METQEIFTLDIDGWEIEITLDIEFFPNPGYAQTMWEPGEPAHIEDIIFSEEAAIEKILKEVIETVRIEKEGISFSVKEVLKQIEDYIEDENGYLNERLLDKADDAMLQREIEYGEYKRDERMYR